MKVLSKPAAVVRRCDDTDVTAVEEAVPMDHSAAAARKGHRPVRSKTRDDAAGSKVRRALAAHACVGSVMDDAAMRFFFIFERSSHARRG